MPAPYLDSSPESSPSKRTPIRSFFGGPSRRQSFDCPQLHGYRVGRTLGKGKFGKVRTAVDKATGEVVAIKHIVKPEGKVDLAAMVREVQLMQSVDHPRLVKLHKAVDTEHVLYLVVEQLHGGELFDRVVKRGPYPEEKARLVTRRLLDALLYLHAKGIAHRDLKPENILLASQSDDTQVKLIDFGLSRSFLAEAEDARTPTVMKSPKGTVGYAAPEILRQRTYSSAVDLWSLGVVVFILLCGYEPFHAETDLEVQRQLYNHAPGPWPLAPTPTLSFTLTRCSGRPSGGTSPSTPLTGATFRRTQRPSSARCSRSSLRSAPPRHRRCGTTGSRATGRAPSVRG